MNKGQILYFAYGSNMSVAQMTKRCPSAAMVGLGRLPGFELVFNRKGSYRPGAVASIEPKRDQTAIVHGVVWRISTEDLEELDRIEDPTAYYRRTLPIQLKDDGEVECEVYISFPNTTDLPPDPEYLTLIVTAAKEVGLPQPYIKGLEQIVSRGTPSQGEKPI